MPTSFAFVRFPLSIDNLSRIIRNLAFFKDAYQLSGNRSADQRLCFRYIDRTVPLLPKTEISSLYPSSVTVQLGLCRTRSETPKTGFLVTRYNLTTFAIIVMDLVKRVSGKKTQRCLSETLISSELRFPIIKRDVQAAIYLSVEDITSQV